MTQENKMLIDAAHPEETRVVVLRGNRVEEFDYESATKKPLRGNIYLAKVTRVEPSLQAAFVEYGGNRHGFLAFSDIHPDYYQIPVADREALLAAEAEQEAQEEAAVEAAIAARPDGDDAPPERPLRSHDDQPDMPETGDAGEPALALDADQTDQRVHADAAAPYEPHGYDSPTSGYEPGNGHGGSETAPAAGSDDTGVEEVDTVEATDAVEEVGNADVEEEVPQRRRRPIRSYKIQEVIKRRQIILVQVVKEERGNKGAALTTYLSLAGRYTVLMPNTDRGGGISRKITNAVDRKRLKEIATDLEVPGGMGLIVRTAGAARTRPEVKRDFEYLLRLWESIRELTLESSAPALVYEEGNLIKRSIRDLFTKDVEEVVVSGGKAFEEASDFMNMLMPTHIKSVRQYNEAEPLFTRYQIERQLNAMYSPYVTLRSGGYIVLNQTEALVSIDVNSGKSTRERSIEDTALTTNLEASDEVARQLRLRDLAGLIVIDFIDMEERRNNRAVERRLKEALKYDRARIQVGRISHFGLLEMSRQRLRTGVLEGSTSQCAHCQGTGVIRSTESVALSILRSLEDTLLTGARANLVATTSVDAALYILNNKRDYLKDIEQRYGILVAIEASDRLHGANFSIERQSSEVVGERKAKPIVQMDLAYSTDETPVAEPVSEGDESAADQDRRRRRRRRRGRGDDRAGFEAGRGEPGQHRSSERSFDEAGESQAQRADGSAVEELDDGIGEDGEEAANGNGQRGARTDQERGERGDRDGRRGRRRGRRGGRRNRRDRGDEGLRADQAPDGAAPYRDHAGNGSEASPQPMPADERPRRDWTAPVHEAAQRDDGDQIGRFVPEPHRHVAETPVAFAATPAQVVEAERTSAGAHQLHHGSSSDARRGEALVEERPPERQDPPPPSGPAKRGWWQRRPF